MAIHGIYHWLKTTHQLDWSWIQASEHEAAGNLERAAYEYKLLLDKHFQSLSNPHGETTNEKISPALVKFLTEKVKKILSLLDLRIFSFALRKGLRLLFEFTSMDRTLILERSLP